MVTRNFTELVRDLRQRREVGDLPPVLLLGAGASVESGIGAMTDLFEFVNCINFEEFCNYINPLTASERYRLLARFLQTQKPSEPTPGYRAIAALCAEAYFDLILTTNLDPLLDDALAHARLWRRDYLLLVNGIIRPERLDLVLTAQSPRVKVIKLHGDLFHRFMAWTPLEMENYLEEIHLQLKPALHQRDLLVVGHSLRDERIRDLAMGTGGAVWFLSPGSVPDYISTDDRVRAVIGPDVTFEQVFTRLVAELGVTKYVEEPQFKITRGVKQAPVTEGARTIDDLMDSVVAFVRPDGLRSFTGFVLAEPRVIVTDGYAASLLAIKDRATIIASDQRQFEVRVLQTKRSHSFDPLIIEVPEELKVHGLRINTQPIKKKLEVRVSVAAGERVGISSGVIEDASEKSIDVAPIGLVHNLVEIICVVAPGSCGAPVVDTSLAVRGFIVAGAPDRPPSIMYPASRWARLLDR